MCSALAGAALIGLLVYGLSAQGANRSLDEALRRHHQPAAPEAHRLLPSLTGHGERSLADFAGKVVILNFWASWCPPCQNEAPELERIQKRLVRHDATVLGVTYEDTTSDSLKFIHEYGLTYPVLRDVTGSFAHSYGTNLLPESFVIDRTGHVAALERNEVNEAFLERALKLAEST